MDSKEVGSEIPPAEGRTEFQSQSRDPVERENKIQKYIIDCLLTLAKK